jgi:glycosyltransferase involved in cell wall biosynthesis
MTEPQVSVVLPVYNQADHIAGIVKGYAEVLDNLKHPSELILVVNASSDGSLDRCRELERAYPEVRVLHNEKPGWGRAVRTGLQAAKGEILCYTNSARTSPYTLALHVMLAFANPGMVIKANRKLRYPIQRKLGSILYNFECRVLFDLPVWDINGTPKAFHRDMRDALSLQESGDLIDLEFVVKCERLGLQILEVPIVSLTRHGGESTTNYSSAFKMYWGALMMRLSSGSEVPQRPHKHD